MATEDIPPVLSDVRKRAGLRVIQEFPTESKWTKGQRVSWGGYGSFRRLIPGSSRKAFSGRFSAKQSKCRFGAATRGVSAPRLANGNGCCRVPTSLLFSNKLNENLSVKGRVSYTLSQNVGTCDVDFIDYLRRILPSGFTSPSS